MCFLLVFVPCLFLKVNEREKNINSGREGGGEDLGGIGGGTQDKGYGKKLFN